MKKVAFVDLVVGRQYYVKCGIWQGHCVFVGSFFEGKRLKYRFTYGTLDNWFNHFCIESCKSNLNVYSLEVI